MKSIKIHTWSRNRNVENQRNFISRFSCKPKANMASTSRNRCTNLISHNAGNPANILCLLYALFNLISYNYVSAAAGVGVSSNTERSWRLITRNEWEARPPRGITNFGRPSPYVIVHHSYQPGACFSEDACKASMRSMQNYHMDHQGWEDIGYSFAIGGDGNVYAGRGYDVVGAHAPNFNNCSIGLLLIGNFVEDLPTATMLQVAKDFIKYSVEIGQLREDYVLYGHRQVRQTDCPGDALFNEITKWPHWQERGIKFL